MKTIKSDIILFISVEKKLFENKLLFRAYFIKEILGRDLPY